MGSWRGEWQRMEGRVGGVGSYREWSEGCYGPHNHHRAASEKERELTLSGIKTTAHVGPISPKLSPCIGYPRFSISGTTAFINMAVAFTLMLRT